MSYKILTCDCKHQFQDKEYGLNKRVHTPMDKKKDYWRCTVCLKEKESK